MLVIERTHPHNFNHILKESSIHFEFLVVVVVVYDSQVHEYSLLTLGLQLQICYLISFVKDS
jgi:hypothetical protein